MISVAMCTYNGEKYIKEQIESILTQSYSNIELIICDDGSKDNTVKVIEDYIKKDNRVKLYINEENLGFLKNFEKAISLCSGDFIALSDQDDIWAENKLEVLRNKIQNSDAMLVYSNAQLVDDKLKSQNSMLLDNIVPMQGSNNLYFIYNNSVSGNTLLFKKALKEKIIPFPDWNSFHDIWISFVASSCSSIDFYNGSLVKYRQHEDNVTDLEKKKKRKNYSLKINNKTKSIENTIQKLEKYERLLKKEFPNHENLFLIEELHREYVGFREYLINFKLFKLLYSNKEKLFFSKKKPYLFKIVKMSLGIKAFKLFPFL